MRRYFFFIALLLLTNCDNCIGQLIDTQYIVHRSDIKNTNFAKFELADSFSKAGDSTNASKYCLQIDPYYLFPIGITPENIDTELHFLLTYRGRKEYKNRFTKAYYAPRSQAYLKFSKMREEDQDARIKYQYCGDNNSCALAFQRMKETDSIHFKYLNDYIAKYGWPTYANGSGYAQLIELHNADHWKEHLHILKSAVLKGNMNFSIYQKILNRVYIPSRQELFEQYKNKTEFDVSYMLHGFYPKGDTELIKKVINDHYPIKCIYITYTSKNKSDYDEFIDHNNYWILWDKIIIYVKICQTRITKINEDVPYYFEFIKDSIHSSRLKAYLLY